MHREDIFKELFHKMQSVKPYPAMVVPVTRVLDTTAFFPGGKGFWLENNSDNMPSILLLGQDFGTEEDFINIQMRNRSDFQCPTWRNLMKLLATVNIEMDDCFFSNVFMGLREQGPITGKFPGANDKDFLKRNVSFLYEQIKILKPRSVLTLGSQAAVMMGRAFEELHDWRLNKSFAYYDKIERSIVRNVDCNGNRFICVRLVHPSYRNVNLKLRRYNGFIGNDAEIELLRTALS